MDSKDVQKFHCIYVLEGEKVRLTVQHITGEPQQLDLEAILLNSQQIYRGSMTEEMWDVAAVLDMLKAMQASLSLVEEGLLLLCSPIKILLTPTDEEIDFKELRIEMLEEGLEDATEYIRELELRVRMLEDKLSNLGNKPVAAERDEEGYNGRRADSRSELLTTHVWPRSRMLLSIVSRMYKESTINQDQRTKLKDLIIDEDMKLIQCLQTYEMDGDRRQLYSRFKELASEVED